MPVVLPTKTKTAQEGSLAKFSSLVNFWKKRYATNDNVAIVDGNVQNFWQKAFSAGEYMQQI